MDTGERLSIWETGADGLEWINVLIKERRAIYLGGDGYPALMSRSLAILPRTFFRGHPMRRQPGCLRNGLC